MLIRMRREQSVVDEVSSSTMRKNPSLLNSLSTHIDQLVIIDRNVDLYTPLCTQLTYQGLIDEIFGIKHCKFTRVVHTSSSCILMILSIRRARSVLGRCRNSTSAAASATRLIFCCTGKEEKLCTEFKRQTVCSAM